MTPTKILAPLQPASTIVLPGFTTADLADTGGFVTLGHGPMFTGKSTFGLTLPKPLAFIQNDPKSGELVRSSLTRMGLNPSEIFVSRFLSRVEEIIGTHFVAKKSADMENDPELKKQMVLYREYLEGVKAIIIAAAKHPDIRSVVIDSGTILYEDILFAMFGRIMEVPPLEKLRAAQEMMSLISICAEQRTRDGRRKHIYITAREVQGYTNNKPNGTTRPEGCGKLGYVIKNQLRFGKIESGADKASIMTARPDLINVIKDDMYFVNVIQALSNSRITGRAGVARFLNEQIHYGVVMPELYPTVDPMEFML